MGAQLWTTGPALIYAGFGSGGTGSVTPNFLGTCENKPRISIEDAWKPVFNDLKGEIKPFDKLYLGESATIALNLGRYDEAVYAQLAAQPLFNGTRGKNVFGDLGTLAFFEQCAVCIWVKFPYQSFSAYSGMPAGYRFPGVVLASTDFEGLGLDARVTPLVFEADSIFSASDQSTLLYDFNMSGLPPIS